MPQITQDLKAIKWDVSQKVTWICIPNGAENTKTHESKNWHFSKNPINVPQKVM